MNQNFKISLFIFLVLGAIMVGAIVRNGVGVVEQVTNPTNILSQQEEFHRMNETIHSLCQDIKILEETTSKKSGGFSKEERVLALKNKLQGLIARYNTKARSLNSKFWKDSNLPNSIEYSICNQ